VFEQFADRVGSEEKKHKCDFCIHEDYQQLA